MPWRNKARALLRAFAAAVLLLGVLPAAAAGTGNETWKALGESAWIPDGRANAPRVVYVFIDPNCPYCSRFWSDARPWVESGKVQLRHVMVGILGSTSPAKAAAILSAKDPTAALAANERHHSPGGSAPHAGTDAAALAKLKANEALMRRLGSEATPTVFYRDSSGSVRRLLGAPASPEALREVLGPG